MEIGTTGVSNLARERPQAAKTAPAANDSGPGAVAGGGGGDKPLAESVGAVKESPSVAGSDDKPRERVDITV